MPESYGIATVASNSNVPVSMISQTFLQEVGVKLPRDETEASRMVNSLMRDQNLPSVIKLNLSFLLISSYQVIQPLLDMYHQKSHDMTFLARMKTTARTDGTKNQEWRLSVNGSQSRFALTICHPDS